MNSDCIEIEMSAFISYKVQNRILYRVMYSLKHSICLHIHRIFSCAFPFLVKSRILIPDDVEGFSLLMHLSYTFLHCTIFNDRSAWCKKKKKGARSKKQEARSKHRREGRTREVMNTGVVSLRVKRAMIMRQEQLEEQKKILLEASKAKNALKMTRKKSKVWSCNDVRVVNERQREFLGSGCINKKFDLLQSMLHHAYQAVVIITKKVLCIRTREYILNDYLYAYVTSINSI